MVVYFYLEGGDLSEAFHCYDDYWVNDGGSLNDIIRRVIKNARPKKHKSKKS